MDEKKVREAIEELVEWLEDYEDALNRCIKGNTKGIKESIQNIKTAIEALEKQLPKKPNILSEVEGEIDFDCPKCERRYVMLKEDAMLCCPYCGCVFEWPE